jgi:L-arabinonolactonase
MRCIVAEADGLGECPTWDERAGRLLWIDVTGRRLSGCNFDGSELERQALPDIPGSFALRELGGRLTAYRRRLSIFDQAGQEQSVPVPAGWNGERERFNDGACDKQGRFWVGTMDRKLTDPVGALYRLDPDLSAHRVDEGFGLSNGIAWSPDDRTMYHCDTVPPVIFVRDFDLESGQVSGRRPFVTFDPGTGAPDGCAVDTEGFLWVAVPGAGAIKRFDPSGRLERSVPTPVANPSSVTFGGEAFRTLFITSIGRQDGDSGSGPDGAVFAFEAGVEGLRKHRFAG